jgi:putative spermidine/putrescine transport system permease protein
VALDVIFVVPAILAVLLVFLIPLAFVVVTAIDPLGAPFASFVHLAKNDLAAHVLLTTLRISIESSLLALLVGYPIALHLARQPRRRRTLLMALVLLPFWTSILVKSYAFAVILGKQGIVNQVISRLGIAPLHLLYNHTGVLIGMTHYLVPFVVLPVLSSLLSRDENLYRAVEIMGSGPLRTFFAVTVPLSMPGVIAAMLMTMILSMGSYITPALLGGRKDIMMANLIDFYTRETLNWHLASATAIILLAIACVFIGLLTRVRAGRQLI